MNGKLFPKTATFNFPEYAYKETSKNVSYREPIDFSFITTYPFFAQQMVKNKLGNHLPRTGGDLWPARPVHWP